MARHESFTVFTGVDIVCGVSVDLASAKVVRKVGDIFASGVVQTRTLVTWDVGGAIVSSVSWITLAYRVVSGDSGSVNPWTVWKMSKSKKILFLELFIRRKNDIFVFVTSITEPTIGPHPNHLFNPDQPQDELSFVPPPAFLRHFLCFFTLCHTSDFRVRRC